VSAVAKFELDKNRAEQWYWRFKANNGEIVAVSESYTSRASALHGANVVKEQAGNAEIVDVASASWR
jgi:hypothetical protein